MQTTPDDGPISFQDFRRGVGRVLDLAEQVPAERAAAKEEQDTVLRAARRDRDRIHAAAKGRYEKEVAAAEEVREEAVAAATQRRDERLSRLSKENASAAKQVAELHKRATRTAEKDRHDAEWLAQVTCNADLARIEEEQNQAEKAAADASEHVATQVRNADDLARQYGVRETPQTDEAASPEAVDSAIAAVNEAIEALRRLRLPRLFVGATPWVVLVLLAGGGAAAGWLGSPEHRETAAGVGAGVAVVLAVALGYFLRKMGTTQAGEQLQQVHNAAATARLSIEQQREREAERHVRETDAARATAAADVAAAEAEHGPRIAKIDQDRDEQLRQVETKVRQRQDTIDAEHKAAEDDAKRSYESAVATADATKAAAVDPANAAYDQVASQAADELAAKEAAADTLDEERSGIEHMLRRPIRGRSVRIGELEMPGDVDPVEARLSLASCGGLVVRHDGTTRDAAIALLRRTAARLLEAMDPGKARFTFIDAVGLGETFAGFMHLADYDDALVGGRVLVEPEDVTRRLGDLTEHMGTVIQTYLRNQYADVDAYNAAAGELAEPYRFVVAADLPSGFGEESLRRLAGIAASGPRCGVFVLAAVDVRQPAAGGSASAAHLEDLSHSCVTIDVTDGVRWQDEQLGRVPLRLDPELTDADTSDLAHKVGSLARDAKRVEVSVDPLTPAAGEAWSRDSGRDLSVPVGRAGAGRQQEFRLGRGVAQHALVGGKTGSGKSTLLNVYVSNLCLWYGPDQVEIYLIDFKRGVEFKAYAEAKLPQVRAVAVESDREFGLSVLRRLDAELGRRGEAFRLAGAQDVAGFRERRPDEVMPRIVLVIDEFQELFAEDDGIAQEAASLIDRLMRFSAVRLSAERAV